MYNDPKRYKTRENIHSEMIREVARLWSYDESDLAIESFDPLVSMLLGAFSTSLENVYHELDNSRGRIVQRLAHLLTPDVLTGPQPAHAIMKTGILDPAYTVLPQDSFSCSAKGKDFYFSSVGHYNLYNIKIHALIIQNRVKAMIPAPKENFINEILPHNEVWVGLNMDEDLAEFVHLPFFFDWRNDTSRRSYVGLLSDVRMFAETEELTITSGLVNNQPFNLGDFSSSNQLEQTIQRFYSPHFLSVSSRNRQTGKSIQLQKSKCPQAVATLLSADELQKFFVQDLCWIKMQFPGGFSPDALARMYLDANAFPVVNRQALSPSFELRALFNVFPIRVEVGDFFLGIIDIEGPSAIKLSNVQQFSRDNNNQYLLRQGGVARFDERDASEMLSYLTDLLRDESAMFMALGRGELETDVEQIRKHLERINNVIQKDTLPNWFVTVKTTDKKGKINLKYWTTKAEFANNIAFGTKLNRDRTNKAFTDESTVLLTTTQGGQRPLQGDDFLPVFRKAVLTRGRAVTFEDYRAICLAELGDKIKEAVVKKGFSVGDSQHQGIQQIIQIYLSPNPNKPQTVEQWADCKDYLQNILEEQSSGMLPIEIIIRF